MINSQISNPDALQIIFGILHQLYKLFYCLIYVTLPEVIEDNLKFFMSEHMTHLSFSNTSDQLLGDVSSNTDNKFSLY